MLRIGVGDSAADDRRQPFLDRLHVPRNFLGILRIRPLFRLRFEREDGVSANQMEPPLSRVEIRPTVLSRAFDWTWTAYALLPCLLSLIAPETTLELSKARSSAHCIRNTTREPVRRE